MSRSFLKDVLNVILSNFVSLIGSVLTGLFVPGILGSTNYGYYRMFMLYSSYTALLHFGFVDGVLLKIGGHNYNDLNKVKFRSNSKSFILLEFVISLIIIIVSFYIRNKVYSFIILFVGINTFLINVYTYYQFLSQSTMKFKGYSFRYTIQYLLMIIFTLVLWILYKLKIIITVDYKNYIFITLLVSFIMLLMCLYSFRDMTFGNHDSLILGFKRVFYYCKIGIYLTIAYQISNLIMIIDNQFVSILFKASTYGEYSFSYSMTNTAITILGAVATVLLPHLKKDTFSHMISIYHNMITSMILIVYFSLLAYFPLCILIKMILPEYIPSLSYLRIFLPELGITCSVTMITFNYYNALGKSKFYFYMSLLILLMSGIIDSIMYFAFHSPILLAFGSFVSIFLWYVTSEYFLVKWYKVKWIKNFIYTSIMIIIFFIVSMINNLWLGFIIYLILYLIISLSMFKKKLFKNLKIIVKNI